jgi:hypothetical protein
MNRIPAVFVSCFLFYIVHPTCCIGGITVIDGDAETGDLTEWAHLGSAAAATDILQRQYIEIVMSSGLVRQIAEGIAIAKNSALPASILLQIGRGGTAVYPF